MAVFIHNTDPITYSKTRLNADDIECPRGLPAPIDQCEIVNGAVVRKASVPATPMTAVESAQAELAMWDAAAVDSFVIEYLVDAVINLGGTLPQEALDLIASRRALRAPMRGEE